jgi:DNA-binding NarL/FixJ family response regulator
VPGLEATRQLLAARPKTRVVVLTGTVTVDSVCEARDLGVSGYLIKGQNVHDLPHLVRAVAAGDSAWSPEAAAQLARCA